MALVPLATMVAALRGLAERNEGLASEVGQLRERTGSRAAIFVAKDETIAELRRRAEAAEAELTAARLAHAGDFLARVRRVFGRG